MTARTNCRGVGWVGALLAATSLTACQSAGRELPDANSQPPQRPPAAKSAAAPTVVQPPATASGPVLSSPESGAATSSQELDPAAVPEQGKTPDDFVPEGWMIETRASGLIDGDRLDDLVLQLIEKDGGGTPDQAVPSRNRSLVVLLKTTQGGYRRVGVGPKLLQCTTCGGAFYAGGAPASEVKIDRHLITVTQEAGAREVTTQVFKLRWDRASSRIVLSIEGRASRDRVEGASERVESEYAVGKVVTRTYRSEKLVSTESRPFSDPVPLEDIDYTNR